MPSAWSKRVGPTQTLRVLRSMHTSRPSRVLEEEADHFSAGVGSAWVSVGSGRATTGPRMAGALKDPLLQHRSSRVVGLNRAKEANVARSSAANDGCLKIHPELRLGYDLISIHRIDRFVLITMKHDGWNQGPVRAS